MTSKSTQANLSPSIRAGVRRTAWIMAGCALTSYVIFLASVIVGK